MKKTLLLFILVFCGITSAFSSHVMGGDITYTCLGGNQYQVTLTLYRDCSGATISQLGQTVDFTSSCGNQTVTLPFTGITEVSQLCPGPMGINQSTCNGGTQPGTEQYTFSGVVTLPPCADWIMSWDLCCRNNAITNLQNASGNNLYIQTTLNSIAAPCNNSVQFAAIPTPYLCVNQLIIFNHLSLIHI